MGIDEASAILLIGLVAGVLGGLAGVGGSIIILPALHIAFGPGMFGDPEGRPEIHHTYMAAAMLVNVAVSFPAMLRHHGEGAVRWPFWRLLLPANLIGILAGVGLSNRVGGVTLERLLAVFLLCYCVWNVRLIMRPRRRKFGGQGRVERRAPAGLVAAGGATGLLGGLLGLGGGFMLVPLLQLVCNVRLKNAIATSSAVLCVTAAFGAAMKIGTLSSHEESAAAAFALAGLMAPTAILGASAGAKWLHRMPVTAVRIVITGLVFGAVVRMVG